MEHAPRWRSSRPRGEESAQPLPARLSADGYRLVLMSSSRRRPTTCRRDRHGRSRGIGDRARRPRRARRHCHQTLRGCRRGGQQHRSSPQGGSPRHRRRRLARRARPRSAQRGAHGPVGYPDHARTRWRRDRQHLHVQRLRAESHLPGVQHPSRRAGHLRQDVRRPLRARRHKDEQRPSRFHGQLSRVGGHHHPDSCRTLWKCRRAGRHRRVPALPRRRLRHRHGEQARDGGGPPSTLP